jgi:hypothetical protein
MTPQTKFKPLADDICDEWEKRINDNAEKQIDDLMEWIDAHLPYPAIIAGVILILIALKAIWRMNG